ncbi:MAG: NAD-binding protein, partial [Proteobacteria bacterium]|nr:NAD-binding protein [Pseudomonadota bacterium]
TLVTVLPSDAANVFITLTARNANADLQILSRAEFQTSQKKLVQAGADRVVLPAASGSPRLDGPGLDVGGRIFRFHGAVLIF